MTIRDVVRASAAITAVCAVVACGEDTPTAPADPVLTTIVVTPSTVQLDALGASTGLTAEAFDETGAAMTSTFVWTSSDSAVVTVSSGSVTAVDNGAATITASASGVTGDASVTVAQIPATITVTPDTATLDLGATIDLVAQILDSNANLVTGVTGTWASSDTAVATVTSGGQVVGIAQGTSTVSYAAASLSDSSAITVTGQLPPLGISIDFETEANGSAVCGGPLTCWVSDEWSAWGVVFDFVDVGAGGGQGTPTIAGAVGSRLLSNDRTGVSCCALTGSQLMIFSDDLDSADFDIQWPSGLFAGAPVITVYDVPGAVVGGATITRTATPGPGSFTTEAVSVESPVPIGSIKVGPVGGIIYLDNLTY
jgi:hypothetical protein